LCGAYAFRATHIKGTDIVVVSVANCQSVKICGRFIHMSYLIPILIFVVGISLACSNNNGVEKYFREIEALGTSTDSEIEYTRLVDAANRTNITSKAQAKEMIEEQVSAGRVAYEDSREALKILGQVIPPEQCRDAHVIMIESLQLSSRGLLEHISAMELALKLGINAADGIREGNRLRAESELVEQRGLDAILRCK